MERCRPYQKKGVAEAIKSGKILKRRGLSL